MEKGKGVKFEESLLENSKTSKTENETTTTTSSKPIFNNVKRGIEAQLNTAKNAKTAVEGKLTELSNTQLDIATFATSELTSLEDKKFL